MAWLYVFLDGIVEILWVLGLKYSHDILTWLVTAVLIVLSFYLLIKATEKLPVGSVYAVFTGIGTAGIVLVDTFVFGTPISILKVIFLCCIVIGVIGVKLITGSGDDPTSSPSKQENERSVI